MPKQPKIDHYDVTFSLEDGTFDLQQVDSDPPVKGESFEYEHKEVRIGQVHKVTAVYDDESEVNLTELSDAHHALEEPEDGDELPAVDELADDPKDEDNPPSDDTLEAGAPLGEVK